MLNLDVRFEDFNSDGMVGIGIGDIFFDDKKMERAVEQALDDTAFEIRDALRKEMQRVFDKPTAYTLNSLKVTKTKNHNMQAEVWLKEPDRMEDHYLLPMIEGGPRQAKGFERALGGGEGLKLYPSKYLKLNAYGNISRGLTQQIMSTLGLAGRAGYQANVTGKSALSNKGARDFVYLDKETNGLPPGVYERVALKGKGISRKDKSAKGRRFDQVQKGARGGYTKGRGLRPVLLKDKQQRQYKSRFDFYGVAQQVMEDKLQARVEHYLHKMMIGGRL